MTQLLTPPAGDTRAPDTKEDRAAKQAAQLAKLEAELQKTIDLVTAMFWEIESGENLTPEQVAACYHDRVLGILWCRVWDYAIYRGQRGRVRRVAHDDAISLYLDYASNQCDADVAALLQGRAPAVWFSEKVRAKALEGHPRTRAYRRRITGKKPAKQAA